MMQEDQGEALIEDLFRLVEQNAHYHGINKVKRAAENIWVDLISLKSEYQKRGTYECINEYVPYVDKLMVKVSDFITWVDELIEFGALNGYSLAR